MSRGSPLTSVHAMDSLRAEIVQIESMLHSNNQKEKRLLSMVNNLRKSRLDNQHADTSLLTTMHTEDAIQHADLPWPSEQARCVTPSPSADDCSVQSGEGHWMDARRLSASNSSSHTSTDDMYNNLLDRITRLESYLTQPCRDCQANTHESKALLNQNNHARTHDNAVPRIKSEHHFHPVPLSDLVGSFRTISTVSPPSESTSQSNAGQHQQPIIMQGYISSQTATLVNMSAAELITTFQSLRTER